MTQYNLIYKYLKTHKSITPALIGGTPYHKGFFGSQIGRRCRELRQEGILASFYKVDRKGKYSRFISFYINK